MQPFLASQPATVNNGTAIFILSCNLVIIISVQYHIHFVDLVFIMLSIPYYEKINKTVLKIVQIVFICLAWTSIYTNIISDGIIYICIIFCCSHFVHFIASNTNSDIAAFAVYYIIYISYIDCVHMGSSQSPCQTNVSCQMLLWYYYIYICTFLTFRHVRTNNAKAFHCPEWTVIVFEKPACTLISLHFWTRSVLCAVQYILIHQTPCILFKKKKKKKELVYEYKCVCA